jgi:hypothetical protein
MRKLFLGTMTAGMLVAAALVANPAQAANSASSSSQPVTVVATVTSTAVLAADGIQAAKTECTTVAGPDAGLTRLDKIVFLDPAGKVAGEGQLTKVSLKPQAGELAYFFNCQFSGSLKVSPATYYMVKLGKKDPIKVTSADLIKNKGFLKLNVS